VKLVDVVFGLFAATRLDEGAAFLVDFEHVQLGLLAGVTEDALEYHGDVTHEVDGVIEDNDVPRRVERDFGVGVVDDDSAGLWHRNLSRRPALWWTIRPARQAFSRQDERKQQG